MELINSFAVVAYLSDPVARFVDKLRREMTPGCPHRAHVTVLPPRPLWIPADEAVEQARSILSRFEPFEMTLGAVTMFESTHVVKLSVQTGLNELRTLHDILNTGPFDQAEEYQYVPHVTLCHDVTGQDCTKHFEFASERWAEFGAPPVWVDTLTFVQQNSEAKWTDLADLALGRPDPVRVRR
ncbi:MAG: 2'-5' RNA ligase family protein [Bryobacterales bacterium]